MTPSSAVTPKAPLGRGMGRGLSVSKGSPVRPGAGPAGDASSAADDDKGRIAPTPRHYTDN